MLPELLLALIKVALINMNMVHRAPLLQQYACDFFSCRFPLPFSRGQKMKKKMLGKAVYQLPLTTLLELTSNGLMYHLV